MSMPILRKLFFSSVAWSSPYHYCMRVYSTDIYYVRSNIRSNCSHHRTQTAHPTHINSISMSTQWLCTDAIYYYLERIQTAPLAHCKFRHPLGPTYLLYSAHQGLPNSLIYELISTTHCHPSRHSIRSTVSHCR